MVVACGVSLEEMIAEVFRKDGALFSERVGIKLTPEVKERLQERMAAEAPVQSAAPCD